MVVVVDRIEHIIFTLVFDHVRIDREGCEHIAYVSKGSLGLVCDSRHNALGVNVTLGRGHSGDVHIVLAADLRYCRSPVFALALLLKAKAAEGPVLEVKATVELYALGVCGINVIYAVLLDHIWIGLTVGGRMLCTRLV